MDGLNGRTFLISGGARGQGAAIAGQLVELGARVALADIDAETGARTAAELGPSARFIPLDVSDRSAWGEAVRLAEDFGTGLHGLVNNAGALLSKGVADTSLDEWNRIVAINQSGCFYGMRAAVPALLRAGGGSIVNVSSIAGLHGAARNFAYAAAKWAVRGMTRAAAVDLAASNIRVNAVYPGSIDTEMLAFWTPGQRAAWLEKVPLGRMADPAEVARTVVHLLGAYSSFTTGAEIAIDGGSAAT